MVVGLDSFIGKTLGGRYRVVERIGIGGMGAVYAAEQMPLGRTVALKVLKQGLSQDAVAMERFKREAQIIAQLGHPHIVGMHDFGVDDDVLFIAMEHLQGASLGQTHKRGGPLPWGRTLLVMQQVCRALSAAHARGVIHRDLKPDNIILVQAEGVRDFVKVLDFGIAKLMNEDEANANLTGTGFVPGTPGYIAPEQVMGDGDDPRSDLYSLGITWFEVLAGRRPFVGDSAMKIFLAHMNDRPPSMREVHPGLEIPAVVEDVVMGLLAKDPGGRPASATSLLKILDTLIHDLRPGAASLSGPMRAPPGGLGRNLSRPSLSTPDAPDLDVSAPKIPTGVVAIPTDTHATPIPVRAGERLAPPAEPELNTVERALSEPPSASSSSSSPPPSPSSSSSPAGPSPSPSAEPSTSMTPMPQPLPARVEPSPWGDKPTPSMISHAPERSYWSLAILAVVVVVAFAATRMIPSGDDASRTTPAVHGGIEPQGAPGAASLPMMPPSTPAVREVPSEPTPPTPSTKAGNPASRASDARPQAGDPTIPRQATDASSTHASAKAVEPAPDVDPAPDPDAAFIAGARKKLAGCIDPCAQKLLPKLVDKPSAEALEALKNLVPACEQRCR